MARQLIDNYAVMQNIPTIMGLQLKWNRGAWEGPYYINGARHAWKRDKLKVKFWKSKEGKYTIWVHEQGGESLSLVNWLQRYGGASDWGEAMSMMRGNAVPRSELLEYVRGDEDKIVPWEEWEKYNAVERERCSLYTWMCRVFGTERTDEAWNRYGVTTDERGDAVFWYLDCEGNIMHDKIVRYSWDGHRDKRFGGLRRFKTADGYTLRGMYGGNLIREDDFYVVESEKTAIVLSMFVDKVVVASGGKNGLRDVDERMILLPDIDAYDEWVQKGVRCWEWFADWESRTENGDILDMIEEMMKKGDDMGKIKRILGEY